MTHFILATAGHVDHGKSALVKTLTGTDPDRLPEEKRRGVTIDLGFAELPLRAKDGRQFSVGIVDVPGHEDFVRNMIAGVGSIDLGLLVVAADDGWMPQTEEHFAIFDYLEVSRLVVAITKCDLANGESAGTEVRDQLKGSRFADATIVETSVTSGRGLSDLKTALAETLATALPPADYGKPRLPIDRIFTLRGIGTVITGTLTGGDLKEGEMVWLQPAGIQARIRSIQSHSRKMVVAQPGMRTALNLPDLAVGKTDHEVGRGNVVTTVGAEPSSTLDVLVISARRRQRNSKVRLLKNNSIIDVHHGTSRVAAKLLFIENDSLTAGASALAQLRLSGPLFSFLGDRLVLRDGAQQNTIGGAIVLDPSARRETFRLKAQREFLQARASAPGDVTVAVKSQIVRDKIVNVPTLLLKSPFSFASVRAALEALQKSGEIALIDDVAVESSTWQRWRERSAEIIDRFHAKEPDLPGIDLNVLRVSFPELSSELFGSFVEDLCRGDFIQKGHFIARQRHQSILPPHLEAVALKIRETLAANSFDPPTRNRIASDQNAQQALRFLISQHEVTEISSDLVLLRTAFDRMTTVIRTFLAKHGPATVSQIREELRTSRRVIVPLLEFLDGRKVTRRIGDQRVLAD